MLSVTVRSSVSGPSKTIQTVQELSMFYKSIHIICFYQPIVYEPPAMALQSCQSYHNLEWSFVKSLAVENGIAVASEECRLLAFALYVAEDNANLIDGTNHFGHNIGDRSPPSLGFAKFGASAP
jgi:hypothetical protein